MGELSPDILDFVSGYFKEDFELWDTLLHRPEEFKLVLAS